ncbi:hypothetical protein ACE41H_16825 [Paenibacillus enshidis]|uniref:Uncharacterized protein n=1 Tax=Paenibacillus enshidis TaxID=1458439 RepID=A0ABV5AW41_9BACL
MEQQVRLTAEQIRNAICPHSQTITGGESTGQSNKEIPAGWRHVRRCGGWSNQYWHRRLTEHRFRR